MPPDAYISNSKFRDLREPLDGPSSGYILIMLMLFVALLAIAAAAIAPTIAFTVRRDREEEMIHRGVQYLAGHTVVCQKDGTLSVRAWKTWRTPTTSAFCASAIRIRSPTRISNSSMWAKCNSRA